MTRTTDPVDAARLALLLGELRLPAIKAGWKHVADRADKEGWPAARFLATLAEHEVAERAKRRIERHLNEARLDRGNGVWPRCGAGQRGRESEDVTK
jgi:DNA replication protein DnaC